MEGVGAPLNSPTNPAMGNDLCRSCGACCAALRVGFHESETTRAGGTVPLIMTEPWIPRHVRMRGTADSPPRCIALEGEVGKATSCAIYGQHPGPCKALEPSSPERPNPWCDQARIQHGLPPLSGSAPAPARRKAPAAVDAPTPEPTPVLEKPVEEPPAPRVQEPPPLSTSVPLPPEKPPGPQE